LQLNLFDLLTFGFFITGIVAISVYFSRQEKEDAASYFLAGRNLTWWTIGITLIASNISTEHFIGMAGRGHSMGLAIASYEWMASVTMILVATYFLPKFIALKIFTVPQYLEYRYGKSARLLMAFYLLLAYVFVAMSSVLYSGSLALNTIFGIDMLFGVIGLGIIVAICTIYGGLKGVIVAEVIQGITLLIGGTMVTYFGFKEIGGVERFFALSQNQLHTVLPWNDSEMPWTAVFIGGLWIPNIFYWGLNQFICQRSLAAKNIEEAQKGVALAALIKLFVPFIIVFPGIMAFHLYGDKIPQSDMAYPYMINHLLPAGLRGFMLAALFGAVLSALESIVNSISTIFTMDLYHHFRPNAPEKQLVKMGRISAGLFIVFGCLWAPVIGQFGSVFKYMQMVWGFISPGIVAAFLFGLFSPRTPTKAAIAGMLINIPLYGLLLATLPKMAFLHHMLITFLVICFVSIVLTKLYPRILGKEEIDRSCTKHIEQPKMSLNLKLLNGLVLSLTVVLYIIFF
jgi:SSS family solute:Na+ symporter